MTIAPGKSLLHYRLVEQIGEGGMGVVWKAFDTHLDRDVAIKILPDVFAGDAERLARFEREAKLLASLNHPNIAAVHGLDQDQGVRFLVMELVPGEDLSHRLAQGSLSVEETMRVGLQVTQALEAAHDNGVIHRDLKPANIQLTPDGDVKVLDFGLAKAFDVEGRSSDPSMSPTMTSAGTLAGTILGTAAYMSPEQAHGRAADRRADVWAFGCVLYEMLAGKQAFTGESISDTLASVLKFEPDHQSLPGAVPSRARRLIRRCLVKQPKQRLQAIGEARIVLEECVAGAPEDEPAASAVGVPAHGSRTSLWIGALVVTAVVALTAGRLMRGEPEAPLRKLPIQAQGGMELDYSAKPLAISPDGTKLAFVSASKLWIRDLERLGAIEIVGAEGAANPTWSHDGAYLGFGRDRALWKVPADGGLPVMIARLDDPMAGTAAGMAWLPDDRIVFCSGSSSMMEVSANGGDARVLFEIDRELEVDFHDASALPDGRGVLFMVHRKEGRDTLAVFADDERKIVFQAEGIETHSPVYSPSGHILYERLPSNQGLWAVPFSLAKLEVTGEPFLVATGGSVPTVSNDGTLAYVRGKSVETELAWYDDAGRELGVFGQQDEMWPFPIVSPAGGRVAVPASDDSNWDIWVHDATRGTKTRVSFDETEQDFIAWTPDGRNLIFASGSNDSDYTLVIARADASEAPRLLWDGDECRPSYYGANPHVSPDGRIVAYSAGSTETKDDICLLELDKEGAEPSYFLRTPAMELSPRFSPDGRYLAYQSGESGVEEIFITTFPERRGKWQVSVGGGAYPRWSESGDKLYFMRRDDVMVVDFESDPTVRLGRQIKLFSRKSTAQAVGLGRPEGFDVASDGRFVFVRRVTRDEDERAAAGITLVENWFAEFRNSR
jgi:Tol biopolymer transport system component